MGRMSNRDRIAHAAAEARAAAEEKLAKKETKKASKKRTKRASKKADDVRMKVVWAVCGPSGKPVETFAYPEQDAAQARAKELTKSVGYAHEVRAIKVPMD